MKKFIVLLAAVFISSCGGGSNGSSNNAPVASSVTIADDNGGSAIVGDTLTGNYTYTDTEGDVEGASMFQWLRNTTPISGANSMFYTLAPEDSGQTISIEVTPLATSGTSTGNAVESSSLNVLQSVAVIVVVDSSGSMVEEITAFESSINNFVTSLVATNLDLRLIIISDAASICPPVPLTTGNCPTSDNPPVYYHIDHAVGSGLIFTAIEINTTAIDALLHAGHLVHIIGITDDDASITASSFASTIASISIPLSNATFHAIVATSDPTAFPTTTCFGLASKQGAEFINYATTTNGIIRDLCEQNISTDLSAIANSIMDIKPIGSDSIDLQVSVTLVSAIITNSEQN